MKTVISTQNAPAAIGPYSQGIQAGSLIITSGQLPIDPATGAFPATIEEQTRQSLTNCKAVLEAAGAAMENVIKTTVFLSDMKRFQRRRRDSSGHQDHDDERRLRHLLRRRMPRPQRS